MSIKKMLNSFSTTGYRQSNTHSLTSHLWLPSLICVCVWLQLFVYCFSRKFDYNIHFLQQLMEAIIELRKLIPYGRNRLMVRQEVSEENIIHHKYDITEVPPYFICNVSYIHMYISTIRTCTIYIQALYMYMYIYRYYTMDGAFECLIVFCCSLIF